MQVIWCSRLNFGRRRKRVVTLYRSWELLERVHHVCIAIEAISWLRHRVKAAHAGMMRSIDIFPPLKGHDLLVLQLSRTYVVFGAKTIWLITCSILPPTCEPSGRDELPLWLSSRCLSISWASCCEPELLSQLGSALAAIALGCLIEESLVVVWRRLSRIAFRPQEGLFAIFQFFKISHELTLSRWGGLVCRCLVRDQAYVQHLLLTCCICDACVAVVGQLWLLAIDQGPTCSWNTLTWWIVWIIASAIRHREDRLRVV